jgi:cytochrome c556
MKTHAQPAILPPDFDALADVLERVAGFAPADPGYPNWASIARDGADAARIQSLDAVKAACRSCHQQYRAKYKQEMRDRPITL